MGLQNTPYIDGQWVNPLLQERMECLDPATGEVIAHILAAGVEEAEGAVVAARKAFSSWRKTSGEAG